MNKLLFGLMMLLAFNVSGQSTHIIDFEPTGIGADWTWIVADNASNPQLEFVANPGSGTPNISATVAKFTALAAGMNWALCFTDNNEEITFDATNSTVSIMVYKSVISNIGIKFEGQSPAVEVQIPNTLTNQWELITFDFSASEGNTYTRLVIIPDFVQPYVTGTDRTSDNIIYIDNVEVPDGVGTILPEPTTVPPTPTHAEEDIISIYTEVYTNLPGTDFNPNWGQSTSVTVDYVAAGNNTLKYENLNYQGTQYTNQNVSGYEYLHVDFWTENSTDLGIYLISPGPLESKFVFTIIPETWVSVDIPLMDFVPPVNLADVFQFKVEGNGNIWFDNLYFWKSSGVQLDLTVVLEGPFNGLDMNSSLNQLFLPLSQPYNTLPWNYSGAENVGSIPNTNVVDWILVELRDAASPELATSATKIGQQAAFLLRNGKIVNIDGVSDLFFDLNVFNSLFVVLWHRNHLSVLSASGLEKIGEVYTYNFTIDKNNAHGSNLKDVGNGVWGMYGGNGLADEQIDDLDNTSVWAVESGVSDYLQGDYNMDGQVNNPDKNDIWLNNNGTFGDEYQLIWEDNFDVDGPPASDKWTFDIGTGSNGWGNGELQYYTDFPENVKVENGSLIITARHESFAGSDYTSGRIKTQGKFFFQYGRVDIRTKLPGGEGIWPANWMLGENFSTLGWPACGEIDIMEYRGADPNIIHGAIHTPSSYGGTVNHATTVVPNVETEFHIYSIEWDDTKIRFMVDYNEFYVYEPTIYNSDTWPFDADLFILLNVAVGGSFGGWVNNSIFPQTMEIDYVKVYQKTTN